MADPIKFGSPEYFQAVDQQVNAMLAPQLAAGIMRQEHANEHRAEAQRKAQKAVSKFYGNSKYDGSGRLVRYSVAAPDAQTERVALPCRIVTDPVERDELARLRKQRKANRVRRLRMKKAA